MADDVVRTQTLVVGAGPTGLTVGLYLARDQVDVIVLEKAMPGGQVAITDRVENYPGFPDGIGGPELMERLADQVKRFGAKIVTEAPVTAISENDGLYSLAAGGKTYVAPYVVIAAGSDYRRLTVPGGKELTGRGVSYCATCDGALFKGKTIAVVGGGSSAVDEATFLTKFVDKLYLIQRAGALKAERISQDALARTGKAEVLLQHEVARVLGEKRVQGVEVLDKAKGETRRLDVQGVFVFIGRTPNSGFLKGFVELDDEGFVLTAPCSVETSRPGLFAAGDVRAGNRAQITTAVGDGTIASFFIRERLQEEERRKR